MPSSLHLLPECRLLVDVWRYIEDARREIWKLCADNLHEFNKHMGDRSPQEAVDVLRLLQPPRLVLLHCGTFGK